MSLNNNSMPGYNRNPILVPLISVIGGAISLWVGYGAMATDSAVSLLQASHEMGSTWPLVTVVLGSAFVISGITGFLRRNQE